MKNVLKLCNDILIICEGFIIKDEIFLVLWDMENNKLFGLDGFIKEFYFIFLFIFIDLLVEVVN